MKETAERKKLRMRTKKEEEEKTKRTRLGVGDLKDGRVTSTDLKHLQIDL